MSNEEIEENYYQCQYCGDFFDSEDARDNHVFQVHMDKVEEGLAEIRRIGEEHKEVIGSWKEKMKIEILEELSREQPQRLYEIRIHPEILDKIVEERIFKMALKCKMPNKFDLLCMQDPNFDKVAKEHKELKEQREQKEKREAEIQEEVKKVGERELLSKDLKIAIFKAWLQSKKTKNRSD
jgi:hypothetical protein